MNKPIQTESRKKNRGERRQHGGGAQDEMQEILSQRTNLDMGDGTVMTTAATLEEARQRPDISAEELMKGNEVVTREAVPNAQAPFPGSDREWTPAEKEGMNSALKQYGWRDGDADPLNTVSNVTITKPPYILGDGYVPPGVGTAVGSDSLTLPQVGTAVGPGVLPQVSTPVPDNVGVLNPLEVTGATPPFIGTIGEPLAETFKHHKTVAPQQLKGDFIDFSKMPLPQLKVIVRKMPTAFTGDLALLKSLMTEMYLSVIGLERGFTVAKQGAKYAHSRAENALAYTFYDAPKRERSKLFEAWGRLIESNGVNAGTQFSAYFCSFDGPSSKNAEAIVDVWAADIFPASLSIDAVHHDRENTQTHGPSAFGVHFGGTVFRMLETDPEVAKLLAEQ